MCSLCTALCSHSVLALQVFSNPIQIDSDASDTAVDGVLIQKYTYIYIYIYIFINLFPL